MFEEYQRKLDSDISPDDDNTENDDNSPSIRIPSLLLPPIIISVE